MFFVPLPCSGHNVFQLWKSGFPAEFLFCLVRGGHKFWRIAGAARLFSSGNFFTGDFFAALNHLANRITVAIAEVVKAFLSWFQGPQVSVGEINDMDVIA